MDDESWRTNDDDNEVRSYIVDNNPLQLKTKLPSGNNDRFQVYFYKSRQTYIGTLVVRYKVRLSLHEVLSSGIKLLPINDFCPMIELWPALPFDVGSERKHYRQCT